MKLGGRKIPVLAIVGAACVLAAAAGYFLLIGPQRSESTRLQSEIVATEAKLGEFRVQSRTKEKPLRFAELFSLTKAMPDDEDMPDVLLELSRIADGTGIVISSVSPSDWQTGDSFRRLPIDVVFEGSFYELSDFLYRLRNLVTVRDGVLETKGRLLSVDGVEFSEGSKRFPQLLATVKMSAFVFDESAKPADGGAPAPTTTTTPAQPSTSTPSQAAPTAVGAPN
jgi:type IV pilus assembly protein PilO